MLIFEDGGSWLKGNFHMHTTESDGRLVPSEAIRLYREAGYDFIALSDHRRINAQREEDGFLILTGSEWDTGDLEHVPVYHILGIGMDRPMRNIYRYAADLYHRQPLPQEIVDAVNEAGGIAILAHPAWSVMTPEEIRSLHGLAGAEIYNTVSGLPWNPGRADASLYFDIWAKEGVFLNCFAGDDAHYYRGDELKSYTRVGAMELTRESILDAIRKKRFYASQGPVFDYLALEGDTVVAGCGEEDVTVVFITNTPWGRNNIQPFSGRGEYRFHLNYTDTYFRVELIRGDGKKAWSSPYAL